MIKKDDELSKHAREEEKGALETANTTWRSGENRS